MTSSPPLYLVRAYDNRADPVDVYTYFNYESAKKTFDARPESMDGAVRWTLSSHYFPPHQWAAPVETVLETAQLGRPQTRRD